MRPAMFAAGCKPGWETVNMDALQNLALIRCGLDRTFIAWHLTRRVGKINGTWNDLAASLGLTMDKMISLALCKSPRPDHRQEDLEAVAKYVGMDADALEKLIGENP